MKYNYVKDVRDTLVSRYISKHFIKDKSGVKMIEIIDANFIVDEDFIVREPNRDYIRRELEWYESQSLYVEDIPGKTPKIWNDVADEDGRINSNYGWCIFSEQNGNQYDNTLNELKKNSFSRRATMVYQRPEIWDDYNKNGMSDYICTYANQFFIRDNELISVYMMRSNDSIFGFNNDVAWARYVHEKLYQDLKLTYPKLVKGELRWNAKSLHVYEQHFPELERMIERMAEGEL